MSSRKNPNTNSNTIPVDLLEISRDLFNFSIVNSSIYGEFQRSAILFDGDDSEEDRVGKKAGDLIFESSSLEIIRSVVSSCVDTLGDSFSTGYAKRDAAGKLRILAKYRSDFRDLIGSSGAIQTLIALLYSFDPISQENAVTALLNLSLEDSNKIRITAASAINPLIYALSTGTETAKQNAACALLNLSMIEGNQKTIGLCGAIPPLVSLLVNGSIRGKKDSLTAIYKLCETRHNKERVVSAGAVTPLVALAAEGGGGTAEKAMVVLNRLAEIDDGMEAIVEEGGISAIVEVVETGSVRCKEFALNTMLKLCEKSERNRRLLVKEGAIATLVGLARAAPSGAKHKANMMLKYLQR